MTTLPDSSSVSDLVKAGPLAYERFLSIATGIASHVQEMHASGRVYGDLNIHSVKVGPEDTVVMPEPSPNQPERLDEATHEDLRQVGYLYAYILTGGRTQGDQLRHVPIHPVISEAMPLDAWTILLPPEAKLLVEQLVSPDPTDRIQSAHELVITLEEMQRMHDLPAQVVAGEEPPSWARLSVMLPVAVVLVVVIWILVSVLSK